MLYLRGGCVGVVRLVFSPGVGGVGMMGLGVLYLRGGRVGGGGLAVMYVRSGGRVDDGVGLALLYLRGGCVGVVRLVVFSLRGNGVGGMGPAGLYLRGACVGVTGLAGMLRSATRCRRMIFLRSANFVRSN